MTALSGAVCLLARWREGSVMVSLPEGNMSDASSGLPKKRPPLRGRHVLYLILGVVGFAYVSAPELWAPWVYFTGGSFHVVP
jgi:hypothetical protein